SQAGREIGRYEVADRRLSVTDDPIPAAAVNAIAVLRVVVIITVARHVDAETKSASEMAVMMAAVPVSVVAVTAVAMAANGTSRNTQNPAADEGSPLASTRSNSSSKISNGRAGNAIIKIPMIGVSQIQGSQPRCGSDEKMECFMRSN
ncbi:MAG: hypothetical protein J0M19_14495, partial [Sphingomonadales bacterium]|nr:hypothetical protein [Sphingomonadales bacterium]